MTTHTSCSIAAEIPRTQHKTRPRHVSLATLHYLETHLPPIYSTLSHLRLPLSQNTRRHPPLFFFLLYFLQSPSPPWSFLCPPSYSPEQTTTIYQLNNFDCTKNSNWTQLRYYKNRSLSIEIITQLPIQSIIPTNSVILKSLLKRTSKTQTY